MTSHPHRNWRKAWQDSPAAFLRAWRKRHGLTQAGASTLLGIGVRAWINWEVEDVGSKEKRVPPPYLPYALFWLEKSLPKVENSG